MRYSGLLKNDMAAAPGVSVTFFTQGCPHRCKGCHNPESWDFDGGKEFTPSTLDEIVSALRANHIDRTFCVMGGEPLCDENALLVLLVLQHIKNVLPDTKVYIWTGYEYEVLLQSANPKIHLILELTDVLIDGPYIESLRDVTLCMRGSSNQRVIILKENNNGRTN